MAMTTIYSRLNDFKGMVYHLEKVIKSGDFISNDLLIIVFGDAMIKVCLNNIFLNTESS